VRTQQRTSLFTLLLSPRSRTGLVDVTELGLLRAGAWGGSHGRWRERDRRIGIGCWIVVTTNVGRYSLDVSFV
jgi:hypothetical protein